MDRTRRERAVRLLVAVADQFPRAYVRHPRGVPLPEAAKDPEWWRGPDRFILPRDDALDHWEATRLGDPWAYVELGPRGTALGLQVEGPVALEALDRVLAKEDASRLEAFLGAAARQDDEAESAAVAVALQEDGRWSESVIDGRSIQTAMLGPEVLRGLLDAARRPPAAGAPGTAAYGIRLTRVPVDETDAVALRRAAKRVVDLWRPLWGVPVPRARERKPDLDVRLGDAYRRSLRLIAGSMGPAERADLRVEARSLLAAYREAGLQRPRLLDVVSERLGLL